MGTKHIADKKRDPQGAEELKPDEPSLLNRLGVPLVTHERAPEVYAELVRMARQLRIESFTNNKTIGLLPVALNIPVTAIGVNLALVLAELTQTKMALLDPKMERSALATLYPQEQRESKASFYRCWLAPSLALFALIAPESLPIPMVLLRETLAECCQSFDATLVDLTGLIALGEHLSVFEWLDAVVLLARVGETQEMDLIPWQCEIPSAKHLGVLLIA